MSQEDAAGDGQEELYAGLEAQGDELAGEEAMDDPDGGHAGGDDADLAQEGADDMGDAGMGDDGDHLAEQGGEEEVYDDYDDGGQAYEDYEDDVEQVGGAAGSCSSSSRWRRGAHCCGGRGRGPAVPPHSGNARPCGARGAMRWPALQDLPHAASWDGEDELQEEQGGDDEQLQQEDDGEEAQQQHQQDRGSPPPAAAAPQHAGPPQQPSKQKKEAPEWERMDIPETWLPMPLLRVSSARGAAPRWPPLPCPAAPAPQPPAAAARTKAAAAPCLRACLPLQLSGLPQDVNEGEIRSALASHGVEVQRVDLAINNPQAPTKMAFVRLPPLPCPWLLSFNELHDHQVGCQVGWRAAWQRRQRRAVGGHHEAWLCRSLGRACVHRGCSCRAAALLCPPQGLDPCPQPALRAMRSHGSCPLPPAGGFEGRGCRAAAQHQWQAHAAG